MPAPTEYNAQHNHENNSSWSHKLLLGGGVATAGIVAAPYIGSFFNIGRDYVPQVMSLCGGGSGLALYANKFLAGIPLVGESLAEGGMATTISSGVLGIGGMLLGNYIQKKYDANSAIPWGKIIKYACLTTSILISLPSILTGLSVGIAYLVTAFSTMQTGGAVLSAMAATLGMTAMNSAAAGAGIGSLLTHFFTCGGAALSVAGALFLDKEPERAVHPTKDANDNGAVMEVTSCSPIIRGQICQMSFRLKDKDGKQLGEADLCETHTKKLHVMLTDKSLTDYHHIHPEYNARTGLFSAEFTPRMQSSYSAWHDFTIQNGVHNGAHFVLKNELPAKQDYGIAATIKHSNQASAEGINISIKANPPLGMDGDSMVQIKAVDDKQKPVKLEPILGAFAHLVGFSKDSEHFLHCHPLEGNSAAGELNFHITPAQAGFNKFFLQIKTEGREVVIPFGQYIQPPTKFAEREELSVHNKLSTNCGNPSL